MNLYVPIFASVLVFCFVLFLCVCLIIISESKVCCGGGFLGVEEVCLGVGAGVRKDVV